MARTALLAIVFARGVYSLVPNSFGNSQLRDGHRSSLVLSAKKSSEESAFDASFEATTAKLQNKISQSKSSGLGSVNPVVAVGAAAAAFLLPSLTSKREAGVKSSIAPKPKPKQTPTPYKPAPKSVAKQAARKAAPAPKKKKKAPAPSSQEGRFPEISRRSQSVVSTRVAGSAEDSTAKAVAFAEDKLIEAFGPNVKEGVAAVSLLLLLTLFGESPQPPIAEPSSKMTPQIVREAAKARKSTAAAAVVSKAPESPPAPAPAPVAAPPVIPAPAVVAPKEAVVVAVAAAPKLAPTTAEMNKLPAAASSPAADYWKGVFAEGPQSVASKVVDPARAKLKGAGVSPKALSDAVANAPSAVAGLLPPEVSAKLSASLEENPASGAVLIAGALTFLGLAASSASEQAEVDRPLQEEKRRLLKLEIEAKRVAVAAAKKKATDELAEAKKQKADELEAKAVASKAAKEAEADAKKAKKEDVAAAVAAAKKKATDELAEAKKQKADELEAKAVALKAAKEAEADAKKAKKEDDAAAVAAAKKKAADELAEAKKQKADELEAKAVAFKAAKEAPPSAVAAAPPPPPLVSEPAGAKPEGKKWNPFGGFWEEDASKAAAPAPEKPEAPLPPPFPAAAVAADPASGKEVANADEKEEGGTKSDGISTTEAVVVLGAVLGAALFGPVGAFIGGVGAALSASEKKDESGSTEDK